MRVIAIEVSGFRGLATTIRLNLDADAVIVVGANGYGKTSLLDAVLWALTGRVPRLGERSDSVVSMYSSAGQAKVTLQLGSPDGTKIRVTRTRSLATSHLKVELGANILEGEEARLRLLKEIWPEALVTTDSEAALTSAMTRSVYLQQDLIREFIDADSDEQRFRVVSELVGTGRITELQMELEHARKSWVRASNIQGDELEMSRGRLASLESRLKDLRSATRQGEVGTEDTWAAWWKRARELGLDAETEAAAGSTDASQVLNTAMKQLEALRRSSERTREIATALLADLDSHRVVEPPDPRSLRTRAQQAADNLRASHAELTEAQTRAAEIRRRLVEKDQTQQELRALAQLALRHLGERCPVCEQIYDVDGTRRRLEELARAPKGKPDAGLQATAEMVSSLARTIEEYERTRSELGAELAAAEHTTREEALWKSAFEGRLREIGVEPVEIDEVRKRLQTRIQQAAADSLARFEHQSAGEALSFRLAQAAERARMNEIEMEVERLRSDVSAGEAEVRAKQATATMAARILRSIREGGSDIVSERLRQIAPVLERVYARIDPHPSFKVVRLLARLVKGRGTLQTVIDDPVMNLSSETPGVVLSSSQMNALAVSVFLAFNLGIATLPLSTAMLDDPLQSLDDVNLLGVVDLLRRTKDRRQLIIATHDARFGRLLERKLRPIGDGQRTRVIEITSWGREGPTFDEREVTPEGSAFRVVA